MTCESGKPLKPFSGSPSIPRILIAIGDWLVHAGCKRLDWRADICIMPDEPYQEVSQ